MSHLDGATTDALPVAPSLAPTLAVAAVAPHRPLVDGRVVLLCAISLLLALAAGVIAQLLTRLIALFTNLFFYGRFASGFASPAGNHLGPWVIAVPVAGAL